MCMLLLHVAVISEISCGYIKLICELIKRHFISGSDNWGTFLMNNEVTNIQRQSYYQAITNLFYATII